MPGHVVGIQVGATTSPAELGDVAAEVERLGYGEIWLAEDYFELGGIASTAVALAATEEIPIGLGVVAGAARHPAVTAMEFATLSDAYPGRFMAGLGHGSPGWVRQMGLEAASPLRSLREVTSTIRRLLDGAEVTLDGDYFRFDRVRLTHPPRIPVRLYLGVHGPASLRLSGEVADGTLLGWFSSPGYVSWARDRILDGRSKVGRTDPHELVVLCVLAVSDDDPEGVRRRIAAWAQPMLAGMVESPQARASGMRHALAGLPHLDQSQAGGRLPASVLDEFVAAGDTETCGNMVDRLLEAGADRVVLVPNPAGLRSTESMVEQIRIAARLARQADGFE